jgi:hypothetical protein
LEFRKIVAAEPFPVDVAMMPLLHAVGAMIGRDELQVIGLQRGS